MPLILLILPVVSTLLGGLLAVHFRRSITVLIALGAGLLLGAAFLDLLPEALSLGALEHQKPADILGVTLLSFLAFFALQFGLDSISGRGIHSPRTLGRVGGALMIFHSLRDGMAIGLSFAASHSAGYAVAAGIAAHDLGDGMNTVILTTRGQKPEFTDWLFLIVDSLAPFFGGLLTYWFAFSLQTSVLLLAMAAGFFLQMATSDFLPEIRHQHGPNRWLLPAVFLGASLIYIANLLIGRI